MSEAKEVQKQGIDDADLNEAIQRLEALRDENGEREGKFPKIENEADKLTEKNESVFEAAWEKVKAALKFLVVKPIKWAGHQIIEHPFRTLLIALSAFAGYKAYGMYKTVSKYLSPLSSALTALKEKGLKITSSLLPETKAIDPTQAGFLDRLMNVYSQGNVKEFLAHPIDQGVKNWKSVTGSN